MESWMVSLFVVLAGGIGVSAVLRANVQRLTSVSKEHEKDIEEINLVISEKKPLLDYLVKTKDELLKRISSQRDDLTSLKEKISQAPSMREVRDEFVSKDLFVQMNKNIDEKFERLEGGINKILTKLEK